MAIVKRIKAAARGISSGVYQSSGNGANATICNMMHNMRMIAWYGVGILVALMSGNGGEHHQASRQYRYLVAALLRRAGNSIIVALSGMARGAYASSP